MRITKATLAIFLLFALLGVSNQSEERIVALDPNSSQFRERILEVAAFGGEHASDGKETANQDVTLLSEELKNRDLEETDEESASSGVKIIPQSGFMLYLYFFGLCYNVSVISLVYRRYMIKCTEIISTLIGKKSLVLSPMLYSFFFSFPFITTSFFSYFVYGEENHYAIYCILGSDAMNITLLWGLCLWNTKLPYQIDKWYFARDSFFYICQVSLLAFNSQQEAIEWYYSALQLILYMIYFMNQRNNRQWKERVYKILGLRHADDEFDCTPYKKMHTKGYHLKELKEEGYIDMHPEQLKRIINVYAGFITLRNRRRRRIKSRFQKYVRTIIHAIHNKRQKEKEQRIEAYGQYLKDFFKQLKEKEDADESDFGNEISDQSQDEDDEMISFDSEDGVNLSHEDDEDERIRKLDPAAGKKEGKDEDEFEGEKDVISLNSDMDNHSEDDGKIEYYNEYVLQPNHTFFGWLNYIFYLPANLLCYIIFKDFHDVDSQSPNKLAYYTIMCLIVVTVLSYLLAFWSAVLAKSVSWLSLQTIAFTIGAWGLQMHYIYYNRKLAKSQNENKQFAFIIYFRQVGLLKIGFGIGFMWFLMKLFLNKNITMKRDPYKFQVVAYVGLTIAHTLLITLCQCQVKDRKFIWYLLVLYLTYMVMWFVQDYMK